MNTTDRRFCIRFIDEVLEKIFDEIKTYDLKTKELVYNEFEKAIFENCFKEYIYCLNLSRVTGELTGQTPEERFIYFDKTDFGINKIKTVFPTLLEELKNEFMGKVQYVVDIVSEYEKNKGLIGNRFFNGERPEIINIKCGGDWHNDKCVLIIEAENNQKIVFKPTNKKNIEFLQEIIKMFFDEQKYIELYDSLNINEGYWCRFIEHIENKANVKEFYRNYGKILFLAYILGMNDLHYENMIAHGRFPVISDVETIFSTYISADTKRYYYDAHRKAVSLLSNGTISTGLLPVFSMVEYFGGDVSCLSNTGMKVKVQKIKNLGRDDMCIYDEYEIIKTYLHLPYNEVEPLNSVDDILKGFEEATEIWKTKKDEAKYVILKKGKSVESRIILAMSKAYSKICRMRSEVAYREDFKKYEKLIEKLKSFGDYDAIRFSCERIALINGNIPCYYWNESANPVYTYLKKNRINISISSHLKIEDIWKIILNQVSSENIIRQKQYIEDTIQTTKAMVARPEEKSIMLSNRNRTECSPEKIKSEYKKVVDNIIHQVVEGKDGTVEWIGLTVAEQDQLAYQVVDSGIYKGNSGLGILLIQYYILFKDEKVANILGELVHTYSVKERKGLYDTMETSFYNGLTGIYYFLQKYIAVYENKEAVLLKEKIEIHILENIKLTTLYDNVGGLLSTIIYFYALYKASKDKFAQKVLEKIGDYYLKEYKIDYVISNFDYASFAHGYEAHLTAALCLYTYFKDNRLLTIIKALYEKQNKLNMGEFCWKDTRKKNKLQIVHFWCHGSCGIMFSRLIWKTLDLVNSPEVKKICADIDLDKSLESYANNIISGKFDGVNYSLCHGNIAFIDFLISYHKFYKIPYNDKTRAYILKMVNNAIANNLNCLTPGAINSISFMVGEAGIAYTFQRMFSKVDTSILALSIV